ncbi:hypothetical protein HJB76_22330 [Rhizobium lentis]|uniref:CheB-type methylesterase domain-containing protein n=1 Tax=Rhizobium lentis TaxID=1138194 RepID=A0ABS7I8G1_9HYPH|nr:hypothetical protein [Rhizobium lentis]MBX4976359.1 hypothetical protein [Rhizobium lentis]MBX4988193.1 hypothetical protein [Rhizobium lentis]MBX5006642.1 hypothetical protein [Rhizobium lentis]MBX5037331.1 hypothetical protein [Rhizobium lentis]
MVVIHRPIEPPSYLPEVLGRLCALPVRFAREGEQLEYGTCLLNPPRWHLSVSCRRNCPAYGRRDPFGRAERWNVRPEVPERSWRHRFGARSR